MVIKEVSHSELDALRQCALKHELGYREHWKPAEVGRALSLGTRWHRVMEIHYRGLAKKPFPDEWEEGELPRTIEEVLQEVDGTRTEEQERCAWMWDGYLEHWGALEMDWEIVDVEFRVRGWLLNERGNRTSFRMNGRGDLLVRDHSSGGGLWLVDHKSISRRDLSKSLEKDLDFDDQSAIYTKLLRDQGLDIRGMIFNHARSDQLQREMTLGERFRRTITVRTQAELEEMAREALETFRRGYARRLGGSRRAPRSPDPDRCYWRCPFTEPCLMSRKGRDIEGFLGELGYRRGESRY